MLESKFNGGGEEGGRLLACIPAMGCVLRRLCCVYVHELLHTMWQRVNKGQ